METQIFFLNVIMYFCIITTFIKVIFGYYFLFTTKIHCCLRNRLRITEVFTSLQRQFIPLLSQGQSYSHQDEKLVYNVLRSNSILG